MSSISAVSSSTGLSNLMQMLSVGATPAVSALLASSKVQTALAKAPTSDIVQLSDQAMQLQMVSGLFGGSDTSSQTSDASTMANLFASIFSPSSTTTAAATQQETANLAQANVLAGVYSPSTYSASGAVASTSDSGSLINFLA